MNRTRTVTAAAAALSVAALILTGCSNEADTVSYNLSQAADNFKIDRRITAINGVTDKYLFVVEGKCSIVDDGGQLEITCKIGDDQFKKHFIGLSDNVTYVSEQVESADVDPYHYKFLFRPETIVPDVDVVTSVND